MIQASVNLCVVEKQDVFENIMINGKPMIGDQVYCPMCDIYHDNNTHCQQGAF